MAAPVKDARYWFTLTTSAGSGAPAVLVVAYASGDGYAGK
jgi:hypothetical protein